MGKEIDEVDGQLVKMKLPVEITRSPRSLTERKLCKASEWRAFLLFYSLPAVKGYPYPPYKILEPFVPTGVWHLYIIAG